mmetsp:Transcript_12280/g.20661  ORF Transcript_12280/g.20661 Transcript_12280/m.20661 type:complete len:106 (+) Transcript_12280:174-491(+)
MEKFSIREQYAIREAIRRGVEVEQVKKEMEESRRLFFFNYIPSYQMPVFDEMGWKGKKDGVQVAERRAVGITMEQFKRNKALIEQERLYEELSKKVEEDYQRSIR